MRRLAVLAAVAALVAATLPATTYADDPLPGTSGYVPASPPQALSPLAALTDPLQPLQAFNLRGGYVSAGVAMRNRGFGTISISGIPQGSSIRSAYLFWAVLANTSAATYGQGSIGGQPIVGTLAGTGGDPCWGNSAAFAYRADVTNLVTGNGSYALTGFASGVTDGRDPWNAGTLAPMAEGASLVVVYENAASPQTQVVVYEGAAETESALLTQTLTWFGAVPQVGAAVTTFIGADGQDAPEPGSTFNGTPLPSVAWDGTDPQAGPAFSHGNLWDTMTTDVSQLVSQGATSATATVRGGPDCLVWVAQVLAVSGPAVARPIIFVHGINGSSTDLQSFAAILGQLTQRFPASVSRFAYYQDKGFVDSGVCHSKPVELPANSVAIPFDPLSINDGICDSQSDLGLNAIALDAYVRDQYSSGGNQPVVLIGNSMGAAIIRGFLAYSADAHDGVATTMVDSIVYLEGAQDGSLWLHVSRLSWQLAPLESALEFLGVRGFPADLSRPAAGELAPVSVWYLWTNLPASHLPSVPSFNVFGDLHVILKTSVPFVGDVSADLASIGDVALMPGTDDPHDVPPQGGARFLDGSLGAQNWQWPMTGQLSWEPFADPFFTGFISQATSSPIYHGNFGAQMSAINVPDCQSGRISTPVDDELVQIVAGRITGQYHTCAP